MICYQISQEGEPVAFVTDIGMARAIVACRPWGDYLVAEVEVPDDATRRQRREPRAAMDHLGRWRQLGRGRSDPGEDGGPPRERPAVRQPRDTQPAPVALGGAAMRRM